MITETSEPTRTDLDQALDAVRRSRLIINRLDDWLFDEIQPFLGRRILEVGCGHGNFTGRFLSMDSELVVATDVDATSVAVVGEQFSGHANLRVRQHDICSAANEELARYHFDTIFSINVLEHVERDELAMRQMARLVVPGGRAIIIVPAHPWAYGTMDASIGHFRRYTKSSLARKLQSAGFVVEHSHYANVVGLLGWAFNGRILRRPVPPTAQLSFFNKLVPTIRAFECRIRPPLGLSVVTIARQTS